ncbi:PREDICTED: probable serine/threonine-protein kinase At1g54610 [Brassica oleracea var. oleracea]|uniref:Protein kinase domain-containing protein n=1 Tax=Brassica oleracea var. oleracea TaxID=109376 RepID=A0A0D3E6F8_BRAOL|nr:PREDICTED: probable serine/threonine-protein kinase At1g54610 [Brassica oleracea var. oleracea]
MGCIISKKKSLKRHHHHHQHQQRKESSEKRSSRINSSRIDDSSQSKEEQEDRSSYRDDAKVEFNSSRYSEKHPEISEIGDTDEDEDTTPPHEELKRDPSVAEQVAAGWPAWLVSVAGEALVDWTPRRASTFEKLEKIGQGTYSSVYKARDLINNKIVALKRVRFDLSDLESVKFMAREIIVMRRLDHPNVLKLEGLITASVSSSLYLVFEYMDHDLVGLASIPGIKFSEPQVKCYMKQLLSGLHHCHSRGVLHRDIKGSNLLIDSNGVLKIADFGLATFFDPENRIPLTSRVVTLWYRPPELLLGACHYGVGVDLWSTGCILGELYSGKPILPGKTEVEQLHKIFKLCGSPTEDYWRKLKLPPSAAFRPALPYGRRVADMFKNLPTNVLSLLEALLSIDPDRRGSAARALESEYFRTEPLACDPSSLPKYPPSKEIDAKLRDDAKRQQRPAQEKHERQDSQRRSHERKLIPPVKANPSLTAATENPYLRTCVLGNSTRQMHITKEKTSNNKTSATVSYSGPIMKNRNHSRLKDNAAPWIPCSYRAGQSVVDTVGSNQLIMDQQRENLRTFNRADTMDNSKRQMKIPNDPSWYDSEENKMYMSGPLLAQPSKVDLMLEEHDRQLQEFTRQKAKQSRN